jgi:hypothetical protein
MTTLAQKLRAATNSAIANQNDTYSIAKAEFLKDLKILKSRLHKETTYQAKQGLSKYYLRWPAAGLPELVTTPAGIDFVRQQVTKLLHDEGFERIEVMVYISRHFELDHQVEATVEW